MTCDGTIAAIATAPGRAGIAVVRVSGDRAFAIAERLTGRRPVAGRIAFARLAFDEAVVLAFAAPHSYTGEDVVEFQCHGGAVAPKRVLAETLKAGARLARRGEFTERALLNGRLTYEQAEGVIDLIDAKTDRAAEEAFRGLAGARESELRDLYTELLDLSATAEHALDVDESDLPDGFWAGLDTRRRGLVAAFTDALRRARQGRILRDGALVVLAGRPNAGKSSLMNALLGTDRAIVSSTPGTTRDTIEEWLDLDGWPVRLVDTAGLRETADAIESEGVERARDLIARADVVLDLDEGRGDEWTIPVHAKCDLSRGEGLNVSSVTGEGLDALRATLAERVAACAETRQLPERAVVLLEIRCELDRTEDDPVLFANILRSAAEKLGAHLGATYSEDLLDRLFSRFCVGK